MEQEVKFSLRQGEGPAGAMYTHTHIYIYIRKQFLVIIPHPHDPSVHISIIYFNNIIWQQHASTQLHAIVVAFKISIIHFKAEKLIYYVIHSE